MRRTIQSKKVEISLDPFLSLLIQDELLSHDQAFVIMDEWYLTRQSVDNLCVSMGFVRREAVLQKRAEKEGVPLLAREDLTVDKDAVNTLGRAFCLDNLIVPLASKKEDMRVAMSDVTHVGQKEHVLQTFPTKATQVCLAIPEDVQAALQDTCRPKNFSDKLHFYFGNDAHTEIKDPAPFITDLLQDACAKGASDLHFEPQPSYIRLSYRLDGVLRTLLHIHTRHWGMLVAKLKIMAGLEPTEQRLPQHGRFLTSYERREIDCRLATHPTLYGEKVTLRFLDQDVRALSEMGYSEAMCALLTQMLKQPEGMLIATGPTGSGKTTTLHACLKYLADGERHIMTLEEPVEYTLPFATQTEVSEGRGWGFSEALTSALRQDIDILMVGEVREERAAGLAIRAAMTGHQVLTSLHTYDALSALDRLFDLGVSREAVASYVTGLIAQRLVRKVCTACVGDGAQSSCTVCLGTGYRGRVVLAEGVLMDDSLAALVREGASRAKLEAWRQEKKYLTFQTEAQRLVTSGITTTEEISRVLGDRGCAHV